MFANKKLYYYLQEIRFNRKKIDLYLLTVDSDRLDGDADLPVRPVRSFYRVSGGPGRGRQRRLPVHVRDRPEGRAALTASTTRVAHRTWNCECKIVKNIYESGRLILFDIFDANFSFNIRILLILDVCDLSQWYFKAWLSHFDCILHPFRPSKLPSLLIQY